MTPVRERPGQCPARHVWVTEQGCQNCEGCIHRALDQLEQMELRINNMIRDLLASGQDDSNLVRLNAISSEIRRLRVSTLHLSATHIFRARFVFFSVYCDVPGSPCLSKKGESDVWFVPF